MDRFAESLSHRYVLDRELGRGGMAIVYLARDVKHERPVALKVLNPELAISLGPERFQREIKVAAGLQHPHVLSVHDSGETEGRLWFTMPYVAGESLRDRLRREGTLPVAEAIRITLEAAQALAYAHKQRIVHRDVKPENILLTEDGSTLVADFGIARPLDEGRQPELTRTGLAIGTPRYMAPEQLAGVIDARTDQYALAATCVELLTGKSPDLLARETSPPGTARTSVRAVRGEVAEHVEQALARALAFDPDARYPSMSDFARALVTPTAEQASAVAPVSKPRTRTVVGSIAAVALVVAGGLAARLTLWPPSSPAGAGDAAVTRIVVLPFENLGESADAFFADGMADEVRGKLSALPAVEVIARASSSLYARTKKTPRQIGDELDVRYVLAGTVRWDKRGDGPSRVRVSPELVDVQSGATKWQQPFDTTLTDVFEVQASIAGKVAEALNLTLSDTLRRQLAVKTTDNTDAYASYLRGREMVASDSSPAAVRGAITELQRAVTLDPSFAPAWSSLGLAYLSAFRSGGMNAGDVELAKRAVDNAVRLAPNSPDTHLVSGRFQDIALGNSSAALAELRAGLATAPNRSDLLTRVASMEMTLGLVDDAAQRLEHAARVDPLSADVAVAMAITYARQGRFKEARTTADRAQALRPSSVSIGYVRARFAAAEGSLAETREALRALEAFAGRRRAMAFAALRENLLWALDDEQQRVILDLTVADLDGGRADWALALAETSWLRGDQVRARAHGETAAAEYARLLETWGQSNEREQVMMLRAFSLAYAGRFTEAVNEAARAMKLEREQEGARRNAYMSLIFARIHVLAGNQDDAVNQLEETLRRRDVYTPAWLRIDRTLAPLRANARFQKLVAETGK